MSLPVDTCCGCQACAQVCSTRCITMDEDIYGFLRPSVNKNDCINCNKCEKVCPALNSELYDSNEAYVAYAKSTDLHKLGSSGGAFPVIANYIIENNGVVYGAAFDENLQLKCTSAENKKDLEGLFKSKYLQCDMNGAYGKVKEHLANGRKVLFVSTPCYVQAMRNFLGKHENLVLIDFVCHGVPSQRLFNDNLAWWNRKGYAIDSFDFRNKNYQGCSKSFKFRGAGKRKDGTYLDDPFYYLFSNYVSLRPSCYTCNFAQEKRGSDITISDFHVIEKYFPEFDRMKGMSSILINTELGKNFFYHIKERFVLQEMKKNVLVQSNGALKTQTRAKINKDFLLLYRNHSFDKLIREFGYYSARTYVSRLYYHLPSWIQSLIRKVVIH